MGGAEGSCSGDGAPEALNARGILAFSPLYSLLCWFSHLHTCGMSRTGHLGSRNISGKARDSKQPAAKNTGFSQLGGQCLLSHVISPTSTTWRLTGPKRVSYTPGLCGSASSSQASVLLTFPPSWGAPSSKAERNPSGSPNHPSHMAPSPWALTQPSILKVTPTLHWAWVLQRP